MAREITTKTIDRDYISARLAVLKAEQAGRNERMNKYERMIRLDMYEDPPASGEIRVALPTAFDVVEKLRAMLMTRPPSLSVPTTNADPTAQDRAQNIERYLYGVMARMNLRRHCALNEWNAIGLGEGVMQLRYDKDAYEDDFPLKAAVCDPRTVYGRKNPERDRYVEVAHTWTRTRREIEAEFPMTFTMPSTMDSLQVASWLDDPIDYVEYWVETSRTETREVEPKAKLMADFMDEAMMASSEASAGMMPGEADAIIEMAEPTPKKRKKKVRVRRIIHCIMAFTNDPATGQFDAVMIKEPVFMPGYTRVPYISWGGISTPMNGRNESLSVLFPMANGDGGQKSYGVLAAQQLLTSIDVQTGVKSPTMPLIMKGHSQPLDMSPDAQNPVAAEAEIGRVPMDATNPAVIRGMDAMEKQVMKLAVPEVLSGQVYDLSGQAISGLTTAFTMLLGFKQVERERALEEFFQLVLSLTKEYADPEDGWTAWGYGANSKFIEQNITPDEIDKNVRVTVKLSASMPKDENGEIMLLNSLLKDNSISWETFLDHFQKLKGLAADTPNSEIARVLRDQVLRQGKLAELMSTLLGKNYVKQMVDSGVVDKDAEAMADLLLSEQTAPLQQPQSPMGGPMQGQMSPQMMQGPPGGPMGGPMGGMPPGAMPPGAMPPPAPPAPTAPQMPQLPPEMIAQLMMQGGPNGPMPQGGM